MTLTLAARSVALALVALLLPPTLLGSAAADAQETSELEERRERTDVNRWRFEISLDGMLFDNFFQAPDDREASVVKAVRGVGRIEFRPDADGAVSLIAGAGGTVYDSGLEDPTLVLGGIRVQSRPHDLHLLVGYETDRPILDVGDELETADVLFADGEYGYRVDGDWEVKGLLSVQSQSFEFTSTKDNTILGVGPAVRYRGFGSGFSPEIGVLLGGRSATDPAEDHSQTDLYVKVRAIPTDELYLSFRFRRRIRDYSVEAVGDRNFGREDRRNQITALLVYPTDRPLAVSLYYSYQDAESTLASRTFTGHLVIAGITVAFE